MRAALLIGVVLAGSTAATVAAAQQSRPAGSPATCRYQSSAGFRPNPGNLKVGPLVFVGGRQYTSPETIDRFDGQKYAALVLAGHRVTVELPRGMERSTALLYSDESKDGPDGPRRVADGHRVVDFRACPTGRASSTYDGRKATFWSGFVVTTVPRCLSLRVWVDDEPTPRRARIPLGKRC